MMYQYYKKPLLQACMFILVQEACERLAYYGIMPNLQSFLTETLQITANEANSLISIFQALVYFFPLISAILADTWLGSFVTILVFSCLYMAGLVLLSISAVPSLSQHWMVYVALMFFIAFGAGGIKSCVNVMGASQFHPTEHQNEITRFFTFFYAAINIGAIVGGILVPLVKQLTNSFFYSYLIPLGSFVIATLVFVLGSPRYVKMNPQGSQVLEILKVIWESIVGCQSVDSCKESRGGRFKDQFIEDTKSLGYLMPLFALTVPFNICYVR
jgi:dipeptide/tripeptide permease